MIKVSVGDPVSLDCKVTGSPELKVKWMKDGKELQSIRQHKLIFENNISSLKVQSAQIEDAGDYVFEVANHISSCTCKVKVIVLGWCEKHKSPVVHSDVLNNYFYSFGNRTSNSPKLHQTAGRHARDFGLLCSDMLQNIWFPADLCGVAERREQNLEWCKTQTHSAGQFCVHRDRAAREI